MLQQRRWAVSQGIFLVLLPVVFKAIYVLAKKAVDLELALTVREAKNVKLNIV